MGEVTDSSKYLNEWREQPATYNRRDLLTYSLGVGCDEMHYVYEKDKKFAAFPTYPIVLTFKGDIQDVVNFPSKAMTRGARKPPMKGVKVGLDGERYIEMLKPLPPKGGQFVLKERLTGVFKKPKGAIVETETLVVSQSGDVHYRILSGAFLVGATGFTEAGAPAFTQVKAPPRAPDALQEFAVPLNQAMLYRLSGDYNPLHISGAFAKTSGFAEPILHGLCSMAISVRLVLKQYAASDPKKYRASQVRFVKPVLPGQTLVVEMWRESATRIVFQSKVKETGAVCVANAFVDLQADAKL